jgi:cytochrome c oxidase subunit II
VQTPSGLPFIPPQASEGAVAIDQVILAITLTAAFFSVGIFVALTYLAVKYRRGNKVDRSNPPLYNLPIEIAWTGIPLLLAMGLYVWSTAGYLANKRPPAGAMQIYVVGKQWMWKMQHPEGRWENNELHVPVGRAVKLTMTSTDVIHSFFVPAFRLHQDVIPGSYTELWFKPTQVGAYHLFCAQFCGTLHSQMIGTVYVMDPAEYEQWLRAGTSPQTLADEGQRLFIQHGCSGCHGGNGSVRAPRLDGIYGRPVPVQIPPEGLVGAALYAALRQTTATTMVADDRYIHDSIVLPEKEVAAGYLPVMPTFKNRLTEEEIFQLTAYIKSLATPEGQRALGVRMPPTRTLTPEEYRTRTGFTPANIKSLTASAGGTAAANRPAAAKK